MSYTIFYRALFVKTRNNKYVPIIEAGDNNVWECDLHRRARSWSTVRLLEDSKATLTANEIMGGVERWIKNKKEQYVGKPTDSFDKNCTTRYTEKDIEQNFGYFDSLVIGSGYCYNTSAQMVRNFFKRAIERAVDFDKIPLEITWYVHDPNDRYSSKTESVYPKTEDELEEMFNAAKAKGCSPWVTFRHGYDADYILQMQKIDRMNERYKNKHEHKRGFVVTIAGHYLSKATSRNFRYTDGISWAHVYTTRKAAEKIQQRIQRNKYESDIIEVVKVDDVWKKAA